MKDRRVVCVDFDGVLNTYTGWRGNDELYAPRDGAREFMRKLYQMYTVVVFTSRKNIDHIENWLIDNDISYDAVTNNKIPALAYIDDRGIPFCGTFDGLLETVYEFKTYWEQEDAITV